MTTPVIQVKGQDDTGAMFRSLEQKFGRLDRAASGLSKSFRGLPAALSSGILVGFIQNITRAGQELDDLQEGLGGSVEGLSQLKRVADIDGTPFERVASAVSRLNRSLSQVDAAGEGGRAGEALKQLGIEIGSFSKLKADERIKVLAKAFAEFEDDSGKASVGMALFGEASREMLPYLKDVAQFGEQNATWTKEQAAQSEALNNGLRRLKVAFVDQATSLVQKAIPAWTQSVEALALFLETSGRTTGVGNLDEIILKSAIGFREFGLGVTEAALSLAQFLADKTGLDIFEDDVVRLTGKVREQTRALVDLNEQLADLYSGKPPAELTPPRVPRRKLLGLAGLEDNDAKKRAEVDRERVSSAAAEVSRLIESTDAFKTKRFEETLEILDRMRFAFADNAEMQTILDQATEALTGKTSGLTDQQERLAELLEGTASRALEKQRADMQLLAAAFESGTIAEKEFIEAAQELTGQDLPAGVEKTRSAMADLGAVFSSAFEDAISGGKGFSEILKGLEQDLIRLLTRKLVTDKLAKFFDEVDFGGISGGIGEFFGSLFEGFAKGGPVAAGVPILVGEEGPEIFTPPSMGRIVPNGQIAGAGGVSVVMNVSTPDVASFRGSAGQITSALGLSVRRAVTRYS